MRFRSLRSFLFAALLGALVAVVIKIGYALPGVLPTSDIFMFILESPLGKFALAERGGEGGVLIAIAIRAFTSSVIVGAIAGAMLRKLRFKRAFCYSTLWAPLGNVALGYLALSAASASNSEQVFAMQKSFGQLVWTDLWVYGWYFLTLYISFIITNRITLRSTGPAQTTAQSG
jgi:hypothetical protein